MPKLSTQSLSHLYRSKHVLSNISLSINTGEIVSISGSSGSGKSTLLYILSGLLRPSSGAVFYNDLCLYELSNRKRQQLINNCFGFIFQDYHLISDINIMHNILMPAYIKQGTTSIHNPEISRSFGQVQEYLRLLDIQDLIDANPNQLSGGEQQRVAMIRALINDPEIVFCDEPTGNLDPVNSRLVIDRITQINKEKKKIIIIVTHNDSLDCGETKKYRIEKSKIMLRK